jgi:hypothetical protein
MANWIYNGVELPALPTWDSKMYPYAMLIEPNSVFVSDTPWFYNGEKIANDALNGGMSICTNGVWGNFAFANFGGTSVDATKVRWANYDVLALDDSVYLAASDPVTVSGNWIYNWVELPPLPADWDSAAAPYVTITYGDEDAPFYLGVTSVRTVVDGQYFFGAESARITFYIIGEDGNWEFYDRVAYGRNSLADYPLLWTNDDIIDTRDGSVYLAASHPIGAPKDEPTEGVSIGKKYLLRRLFPPYIARMLSER